MELEFLVRSTFHWTVGLQWKLSWGPYDHQAESGTSFFPEKFRPQPLESCVADWSGAYRILECSLSLQSFHCLNFSVLTKSWEYLIDDRPKWPGLYFLVSIFVAG